MSTIDALPFETFTVPLLLAGDPVVPLQAATKQYTDTRLLRTGDTLTGTLVLASDPVLPAQAATKNYVDVQRLNDLSKAGGTLTGPLILNADPTSSSQAATKHYVDMQTPAGALPITGGSLTGALSLAAAPSAPLQAASKQYVDTSAAATGVINVTLAPYLAKLNGVTDDTAAFKAAYLAASSGAAIYVPFGSTVLQPPASWGVVLTKRVKWFVDGTTLADGTPLAASVPTGTNPAAFTLPGYVLGNTTTGLTASNGNSAATDLAVLQSSYIVAHNGGTGVVTNGRLDTIIYNSPGSFVWGGLDRLVWAGTQTPTGTPAAQHVGRYVQTLRSVVATGTNGLPLSQPELWGACIEYRDQTGTPSSAANSSISVEMDWYGNGLDDANSRAVQSLVVGQNNQAGAPVEVAAVIGVWLSYGSAGSAKTVFKVSIPFSNAVLDTTNAVQINNAPVIRMAANQAIAFEATNCNRLLFDSTTGLLRWCQGSLSFPVGKGISVGWVNVYSASATLPSYISGNMIFLTGNTSYSITLPAASTVAAGTGFTFSVAGVGAVVSIVPGGADMIDLAPVVLRTNDRYHVISDGYSTWHDVFRTNSVSPVFSGPPVLPTYSVAQLPAGLPAGSLAFAANGRKSTEAAGAGTGVGVLYDGQHWISTNVGGTVAA